MGKSTQIAAVRAFIESAGFSVLMTREPGGTERAEKIRDLLLAPTSEPMPSIAELLLAFAARSTHLENVIRPTLNKGVWVICDRFTDATYAYQGGGRNIAIEKIAYLESLVQGTLRPDLTLLLDAPIDLAMARARQRNAERGEQLGDRFEREQLAFFERVRGAYLDIARKQPERVKVIDASQPIDSVKASVESVLKDFVKRVSQ